MDKLKNMISPGHNSDDQKLYGTDGSTGTSSTTGTATGRANDLDETAANARHMPGSTNMPGGFNSPQDESTRPLGSHHSTAGTANPLSATTGTSGNTLGSTTGTSSSIHPGHNTSTAGTGSGLSGADDRASTTSIKSGIPGNTSSAYPSTGTTSGTGHSTLDPYASSTTGSSNPLSGAGVGSGTTSGSLQDPSFSNRTLHQSNQRGNTSSSGAGRDALAGAGLGAAGVGAEQHHGHHGHHGHHSTTSPTGTSNVQGLSSTTPTSSGVTGSTGSSHPSTVGGITGTHGSTGTTSQLADRSLPHADVGGTTTERSFPLGGHTGEGPHVLPTANRLDPRIPDTAQDFRSGTHQHGQTGSGLSGLTGSSSTGTTDPYSSNTSGVNPTTSSHGGHHLGRDAAAGTGAAGLGAAGLHEHDKHRGTGGIGSSGTSSTTGPTMTSGGVGQPTGQHYDTLNSGTPSGISTRDPAHPSGGSNTTNTHPSSHLGRDAALGAGATGLGSGATHEAGRHHGTHGVGDSLSRDTPSGTSTRDSAYSSAVPGRTEPTTSSGSHNTSHLGRDAALGTGAAGLGSGAAYEAENRRGVPTTTSGGHGANPGHQYNTLSDGTPSGIATSDAPHRQQPTSSTGSSGHHLGRDAGAGAAGVGATGLAAHEYEKHRNQPSSGVGSTGQQSVSQHASVPGSNLPTAMPGAHESSYPTGAASARAQESLSNHPGHSTGQQSHLGRDAAGAAGLGGAGTTAAYEAEKHRQGRDTHDPRDTTGLGGAGTSTTDPTHRSHTGRDAAAATGAGGAGTAAAYEAEKHKHGSNTQDPRHASHDAHSASGEKKPGLLDRLLNRDPAEKEAKKEEKEMQKEEKQAQKEAKKEDKQIEKEEKQAGKEAKKEDKHGHHTGEGAALAGAGAGTAGVAGGEAYRHDDPHGQNRTARMPGSGVHGQQPLEPHYDSADGRVPTTTGTTGHSSVRDGAQRAEERHRYGGTDHTPLPGTGGTTGSHHTARDTGLTGAGATGAGGAAYAGDKYSHPSSGTHQPSTTGYNQGGSTAGSYAQQPSTGGYGQGNPMTSASAQGIDPRVDSPQYGSATSGARYNTTSPMSGKTQSSRLADDPVNVHSTSAAGTRNAPNYAGDSPSSATGGEKQGGMLHNLLHRDSPNKLHKDPPSGN